MNPVIRVAICHGNQLLSDCLVPMFNHSAGYQCIRINPDSAMESVPDCDVLLLDATLPQSTTSGVIEFARRLNDRCGVLLIVSQHFAARMLEFTRLGANGCIFDQSNVDELLRAVSAVAQGDCYCSRHVANALFSQAGAVSPSSAWDTSGVTARLTGREREVLELIAWERLGNKQIARCLSISLYTVKNHVHSIIEKLGVVGRSEAAEYALRQNLIGARSMHPCLDLRTSAS